MNLQKSLTVIMIASSILVGCNSQPEYIELMKLPEKERKEVFREMSIDKQLDYYLQRATYSHPSDTSFADDIALRGEQAVPYLLIRLQKESEDYRKHYIILVFRQIHTNSVDLRKRNDLIATIIGQVEQMHNPSWKERAKNTIQFIKDTAPKYASDFGISRDGNDSSPTPPVPPSNP